MDTTTTAEGPVQHLAPEAFAERAAAIEREVGKVIVGQRVFRFQPGPIFANLVLADEINRATPKTQSSLLECMEERQATIDGVTHPMPDPFIVIATQNPIEYEGTFALPEAQLDRFMLRLRIAEPDPEHEPVELGLRQSERALVLDGVLGGDDQERVGHRVGDAVDRRLPLLHALQERGLGLGRGSVDLVGEDDLAEDGPAV